MCKSLVFLLNHTGICTEVSFTESLGRLQKLQSVEQKGFNCWWGKC